MPFFKSKQAEEEPKVVEEKQTESVSPEFVTMEKFGELTGKLDQLISNQPQPVTPVQPQAAPVVELPPIVEVSDSEVDDAWETAVLSGDASDMRKARALDKKQNDAKIEKQSRVQNKRFEELQSQGLGMFNQINTRQTEQAFKNMPFMHYVDKQVKEQFSALPESSQTPEVAQHIYNMAVGEHMEEITVKEGERKAREKSKELLPTVGQQNGRDQVNKEKTTFASVFGQSLAEQSASWNGQPLWDKNHDSPDRFAKSIGYRDADHYASVATWVMKAEPCRDCFVDVTPEEDHKCKVSVRANTINYPKELA